MQSKKFYYEFHKVTNHEGFDPRMFVYGIIQIALFSDVTYICTYVIAVCITKIASKFSMLLDSFYSTGSIDWNVLGCCWVICSTSKPNVGLSSGTNFQQLFIISYLQNAHTLG